MQNYHNHKYYSNILVADCATSYEAYVKRTIELGHNVISSVEHGFQSNYYIPYELVEKHNNKLKQELLAGAITEDEFNRRKLKFIFGAEAYWVKDRKAEYPAGVDKKGVQKYAQDRTNCHIILLAKNEEGRRDINEALSDANIDGYYGQPRLDLELLLRIKPENVFVTTACLKYWVYEDIEEITVILHNHFKDNFYLEIQYHNTPLQKEINQRILDISEKYGIDIIFGYDSHYIYPEDAQERDNYLEGRGIIYDENERGWYMDYCSEAEVRRRLKEQNVLNDNQIDRAIKNTDLLLNFDDLYFDKEIKLPTLYSDKTQEEKNKLLRDIVYRQWDIEKQRVPIERHKEYEDGIEYELAAICDTNMADYFLIDHEIVQEGIRNGGIVTKTGRGSGVSYYVNSLLGFSDIDRFISPVKLYPDRFISKTRILLTRSLPDLDLNLGNPEIFAEAQEKILTKAYGTEFHSYPMISYKPLQKSSAFKLYAKSQGLDFSIANDITAQIKKYEKALKHADTQEEKDAINLYDYVDKQYHFYLDESKKYQGIINAKSQAPCGYLIYQGNIKREIGLIKCKSESTGKEVITTVIDGMIAENYKFVKNDLLKVDIWLTINKIFEKIGIPTYSVREMTAAVENDEKTWAIYSNGYTMGVNQCESDFGKQCCKRYKPQSMQELTALVAALRPGFKTQLNNFLDRLPYSTGVQALDNLLEDSFHYMMYQENIMTYLGWLGTAQTETYAIIKKISKKKFKEAELAELKEKLLKGWIHNVGSSVGFDKTWEIIEAASKYSFNASHAFSYAYDSVYGAWLKAHYPYEFYSVMLQFLSEKGDKDKVSLYKQEMKEAFGIKEGEYKFRLDNRTFSINRRAKRIEPSLIAIKGFSQNAANELYELRNCKCKNFVDLLLLIKQQAKSIDVAKLEALIKIDYFSEFGNRNLLLKTAALFEQLYDKSKSVFKKQIKKDKVSVIGLTDAFVKAYCHHETEKTYMQVDTYGLLSEYQTLPFKDINLYWKVAYQQWYLKDITIIDKQAKQHACVVNVDVKNSPTLKMYSITQGNIVDIKIPKRIYEKNPLQDSDIIQIKNMYHKPKQKYLGNGKYENIPGSKEWWISDYKIVAWGNPKRFDK